MSLFCFCISFFSVFVAVLVRCDISQGVIHMILIEMGEQCSAVQYSQLVLVGTACCGLESHYNSDTPIESAKF